MRRLSSRPSNCCCDCRVLISYSWNNKLKLAILMHSFGEELRKKKDTKKMEEFTTIKQGNVSYFVYSHPR